MKKKHILFSAILAAGLGLLSASCTDYLSVEGKLGENTQNLDKIFENEVWTEEWLAQAYAFMTWQNSDIGGKDFCITNFADDMCYGDRNLEYRFFKYAEYGENWKQECWKQAYQGIRQASILIHNVHKNKEMTQPEIADIKAQGRFVRAYIYWKLLQKYGPIPIIPDKGLDYTNDYESLAVARSSYDECADFIATEMQLAAQDLPLKRDTRSVSRPTRGAALATRAKVLLYAASPINNPRPTDTERFTDLVDDAGRPLIAQEHNPEKWARAAAAARDVIELGRQGIYRLYTSPFRTTGTVDYPATIAPPENEKYSNKNYPNGWRDIDPLQSYKSIFNGDLYPSDNPEMVFTTGQNHGGQSLGTALTQHQLPIEGGGYNCHAITGKQCDAYEMNSGAPFDKENRPTGFITDVEAAGTDWLPLLEGVSKQYAHREPRFYASVAFNGTLWPLTNGKEIEDRYIQVWYYRGAQSGWANTERWLPTGIGMMKYVSPRDNIKNGAAIIPKASLNIRYADVLLWYAEALNELNTAYNIPSWDGAQTYTISRDPKEMSDAISQIRVRAGLPDYDEGVYLSPDEFRVKLKHERQIEFFAENSRYFDLRRWKDAEVEESQQIYGCNPLMSKKERELYHTQVIISDLPTTFNRKMYFWPIQHDELRKNSRLTQNPGWTNYD